MSRSIASIIARSTGKGRFVTRGSSILKLEGRNRGAHDGDRIIPYSGLVVTRDPALRGRVGGGLRAAGGLQGVDGGAELARRVFRLGDVGKLTWKADLHGDRARPAEAGWAQSSAWRRGGSRNSRRAGSRRCDSPLPHRRVRPPRRRRESHQDRHPPDPVAAVPRRRNSVRPIVSFSRSGPSPRRSSPRPIILTPGRGGGF